MAGNCVFCDIAARPEADPAVVWNWPDAVAFKPLNPVVNGHLLVVPKAHVTDAADDPVVTAAVMARAARLARQWKPCNLITSCGREATQTVFHLAVEIIPRHQDGKALPWTLEEGDCPVCLSFRVQRGGRSLKTCGDPTCAYELRARRTRGNAYGDTGGGPAAKATSKYSAIHARARRALRGQPCAMEDESCSGRSEVALRPDAPADQLRHDGDGRMYFFGFPVTDGYRILCRSHHGREGAAMATARRNEVVRNALTVSQIRSAHGEGCPADCAGCVALEKYDAAVSELLHVHVVPRREGDGLALPWTGQEVSTDG